MKPPALPKKNETWETKRGDHAYVTVDHVRNGMITYVVRWSLTEYTCALESFLRNHRFVATPDSLNPKLLFRHHA